MSEVRKVLETGTKVHVPAGTYDTVSFDGQVWDVAEDDTYTLAGRTEGILLFGSLNYWWNVLIEIDVEGGERDRIIIEVSERVLLDDPDEAVFKTIQHWHRMTDFVAKRFAHRMCLSLSLGNELLHEMNSDLHENFFSLYCPLCRTYYKHFERVCDSKCPLLRADHVCNNEESMWSKILYSDTVSEWLDNARELLDVLYGIMSYDITTV